MSSVFPSACNTSHSIPPFLLKELTLAWCSWRRPTNWRISFEGSPEAASPLAAFSLHWSHHHSVIFSHAPLRTHLPTACSSLLFSTFIYFIPPLPWISAKDDFLPAIAATSATAAAEGVHLHDDDYDGGVCYLAHHHSSHHQPRLDWAKLCTTDPFWSFQIKTPPGTHASGSYCNSGLSKPYPATLRNIVFCRITMLV